MTEPPEAEAIAFESGEVVAVGDRDEVMALADSNTRTIDLGSNVAYPGFIDAHSHWIGDRPHYGIAFEGDAVDEVLSRGWTSIGELWIEQDRLTLLHDMAAAASLHVRVDGYYALNHPYPSGEHLGNWYTDFEPGLDAANSRLRFPGVKITLDNEWGSVFHWQQADLTDAVRVADSLGWQVAVHTVSTEAHEMVLTAFEDVLDGRPNLLHHRVEHAVQMTDQQLARLVALDLVVVIHLDGVASDWPLEATYMANLGDDTEWLTRWREIVDSGLHVAAAVDTPWMFPDQVLTDDIGRPVDQIAGGMDGQGRVNPETPAWVVDQTLTAEQGLAAVTTGAAYALGDEEMRGSLGAGKYADITIMSGDVTAGTADDIRELDVVATIVGGVTEYCGAQPHICP